MSNLYPINFVHLGWQRMEHMVHESVLSCTMQPYYKHSSFFFILLFCEVSCSLNLINHLRVLQLVTKDEILFIYYTLLIYVLSIYTLHLNVIFSVQYTFQTHFLTLIYLQCSSERNVYNVASS